MNFWLRLYTGILDDPKVQRMEAEHFKGWVNLLCLAKENDGVLPAIENVAFRLRTSDALARELIEILKARGLLDDVGGDLIPHNWATRQYETDETASQKGASGNHKRWHVGRGVIASDCAYCRGEVAARSQRDRSDDRSDVGAIRTANPAEQSRSRSRKEQRQRRDRGRAAEQKQLAACFACCCQRF